MEPPATPASHLSEQEYSSRESFATCHTLHAILLLLQTSSVAVVACMINSTGLSTSLCVCLVGFSLGALNEVLCCVDLLRGKISQQSWHGATYKRCVCGMVLGVGCFFVCLLTFLFHANGLSFWTCIVEQCVSDHAPSRWVTVSTVVSSLTSRTLDQQLLRLTLDFSTHDRYLFWGVIGVWVLCMGCAFKALHIRSLAPLEANQQSGLRTWLRCLLCSMLLLTAAVVFMLICSADSKQLGPLFITAVCVVPTALFTRKVHLRRERRTRWHARMFTIKGVALALVLTYAAMLSLVFLVCKDIAVNSLQWELKLEFYALVIVHAALALVSTAAVWVHLGLRTHTAAAVTGEEAANLASPILLATPLHDRQMPEYDRLYPERVSDSRMSTETGCCAVCFDGPPDALIEPCRHLAICYSCAVSIIESARPECPICREKMQDVLQIYLSTAH
eukprot:TRINITY_DN7109_c0_g3_i1.p1 TRINITY_DN7109_c0_g3~~TRINITY_DN7109_c0_g3_i1.p1  ORF type:complete len:447 (-),score=70.45 TRINITY_DN7109_c0_g3_i1:104-1444(-)